MWHISIARINKALTAILPVSEWPPNVRRQAHELQEEILNGVGDKWELHETGIDAVHLRRRLAPDEIKLLHTVNPSCPVFTHGRAMEACA